MGVRAALLRITQIVQAATPKSLAHVGFRALDVMDGHAQDLESAPPSEDRLFELRDTGNRDGGEVGAPPLLQRFEGAIRVRYELVGSALGRNATQKEDVDTIRRALHVPADWQTDTTGIDALGSFGVASTAIVPPADTDAPRHEILSIPFFCLYRET